MTPSSSAVLDSSLRRPSWAAAQLARYPQLAALALHAGLVVALYSALYCFGVFSALPDAEHLLSWDAVALRSISQGGYAANTADHKAFFPLAPYAWRYLHLDALGASLLNAACVLTGLYLLGRTFALPSRLLLLLASAPLLLFGLVPYTEGFFFLFTALLLRGLHRGQLVLTLLGLLGCCLTRSAGTLFVPAYLFAELLAWGETSSGRVLARNLAAGLATIAASVGIVVWVQATPGRSLVAFYEVHGNWGHIARLPFFPLFSSAGTPVLWLDALALMVSLLSLVGCAALGLRWLAQRWRGQVQLGVSKAVLFAMGYCVGAGYFILFYQGGDLVGMSRYVLGSGFWGALLFQAWQSEVRTRWALAALVAAWAVVAVAAGLPGRFENFAPGEALWYFGLLLLYAACYWLAQARRSPWFREITTGLYFLNLLTMVYLLHQFLNKIWVN